MMPACPTAGMGSGARKRNPSVTLAGLSLLVSLLLAAPALSHEVSALEPGVCDDVGSWLEPASGERVPTDALLRSLTGRSAVLLGEVHSNAEHHRWQLHTLAALHGVKPRLVIGFEMFPRRVQPVLDDWVSGALTAEAFLEASEWREVWGFEPALYMPLFHFARQNRLPMVALNVDRALVARVGREGWDAIPAEERAGLSDPAPAAEAYRESLAHVFAVEHAGELEAGDDEHGEIDLEEVMEREDFAHFVEAQLTWDRAMAEAIAEAGLRHPGALVAGVVGQGHIQFGHGVPHQLANLGVPDAAVLLPVETGADCENLQAQIADAVFLIQPMQEIAATPGKPRLGVMIETAEGGVRITRVLENSVAEASAIAPDDLVVAAAGSPVERVTDLIEIVQRQAPGTWLPLRIQRDGEDLEVVAKFPVSFEKAE